MVFKTLETQNSSSDATATALTFLSPGSNELFFFYAGVSEQLADLF
jgi:hypothetical protein